MIYRRSRMPYVLAMFVVVAAISSPGIRERLLQGIVRGHPGKTLADYRPMKVYSLTPDSPVSVEVPVHADLLRIRIWPLLPKGQAAKWNGAAVRFGARLVVAGSKPGKGRVYWFSSEVPPLESGSDAAGSVPRSFLPGKGLVPLESRSMILDPQEAVPAGAILRIELLSDWSVLPAIAPPSALGPLRAVCMIYSGTRLPPEEPEVLLAPLSARRIKRLFDANALATRRALTLEDRLVHPITYDRLPVAPGFGDVELLEMYLPRIDFEPVEPAQAAAYSRLLLPRISQIVNLPAGAGAEILFQGPPGNLVNVRRLDQNGQFTGGTVELDEAGRGRSLASPSPLLSTVYLTLPVGQDSMIRADVALTSEQSGHLTAPQDSRTTYYQLGTHKIVYDVAAGEGERRTFRFGFRAPDTRPRQVELEVQAPDGAVLSRTPATVHPRGGLASAVLGQDFEGALARDDATGAPLSEVSSLYLTAAGPRRITLSSELPLLATAFARWADGPAQVIYSPARVPGTILADQLLDQEAPEWLLIHPANGADLMERDARTQVASAGAWVRQTVDTAPAFSQFLSLTPSRPQAQQVAVEPLPPDQAAMEVGAYYLADLFARPAKLAVPEDGLSGFILSPSSCTELASVTFSWDGEPVKRVQFQQGATRFVMTSIAGEKGSLSAAVDPGGTDIEIALSEPLGPGSTPGVAARRLTYLPALGTIELQEFLQPPETVTAVIYGFAHDAAPGELRFRLRFQPPPNAALLDLPFLDAPDLMRDIRVLPNAAPTPLASRWEGHAGSRLAAIPLHLSGGYRPGLYRLALENQNNAPLWCRFVRSLAEGPVRRVIPLGTGLTGVMNIDAGQPALISLPSGISRQLDIQVLEETGSVRRESPIISSESPWELGPSSVARTVYVSAPPLEGPVEAILHQPAARNDERVATSGIQATYYDCSRQLPVSFDLTTPRQLYESEVKLGFRTFKTGVHRAVIEVQSTKGESIAQRTAQVTPGEFGLSRDRRDDRPVSDTTSLYLEAPEPCRVRVTLDPPGLVSAFLRTGAADRAVYAPRPAGLSDLGLTRAAEPETRRWDAIQPELFEKLTEQGHQAIVEMQRPWLGIPAQDSDDDGRYVSLVPEEAPERLALEEVPPDAYWTASANDLYHVPFSKPVTIRTAEASVAGVIMTPRDRDLGYTVIVRVDGRPAKSIDVDWLATRFRIPVTVPGTHSIEVSADQLPAGARAFVASSAQSQSRPQFKQRRINRLDQGRSVALDLPLNLPGRVTAVVYPDLTASAAADGPHELNLSFVVNSGRGVVRPWQLLREPLIMSRDVRIKIKPATRLQTFDGVEMRTGQPVSVPINLSDGLAGSSLRLHVSNAGPGGCWVRFVSKDVTSGGSNP